MAALGCVIGGFAMTGAGKGSTQQWWKVNKSMLAALMTLMPSGQAKVIGTIIAAIEAPEGMLVLESSSGKALMTKASLASVTGCSMPTVQKALELLSNSDVNIVRACNGGYMVNPAFLCQGGKDRFDRLKKLYMGEAGAERIDKRGMRQFGWWKLSIEKLCELLKAMPSKKTTVLAVVLQIASDNGGDIKETQEGIAKKAGTNVRYVNEVMQILQTDNDREYFDGFICRVKKGEYMLNPVFLSQGDDANFARLWDKYIDLKRKSLV